MSTRVYLNLQAFNATSTGSSARAVPAICTIDSREPILPESGCDISVARANCNVTMIPIMRRQDLNEMFIGIASKSDQLNHRIESLGNYWIESDWRDKNVLYSVETFVEMFQFALNTLAPTGLSASDIPKFRLNGSGDAFVFESTAAFTSGWQIIMNGQAHSVLGCGWPNHMSPGALWYSALRLHTGVHEQEKSTLGLLHTATHLVLQCSDLPLMSESTGGTSAMREPSRAENQITDIALTGQLTEVLLQPNYERILTALPASSVRHLAVSFSYRDRRGDLRAVLLPPGGSAGVKLCLTFSSLP